MAGARGYEGIPVRDTDGTRIVLPRSVADDAFVYPPDLAGFLRFVEDAWLGRTLPRDAFSRVRG